MIPTRSWWLVSTIILETRGAIGSMERKIVDGKYASIYDTPHSVFINVNGETPCCCEGSVLNQRLVLTAAHCFDDNSKGTEVDIYAGHANTNKGNIIGGEYVSIYDAPHSVFLDVEVHEQLSWSCGGSILNQRLILTAGHCLDRLRQGSQVYVYAGEADIDKVTVLRTGRRIIQHANYDIMRGMADIGLILIDKLPLTRNVQRVILKPSFPMYSNGTMSGWGLPEPMSRDPSVHLKRLDQMVMDRNNCTNNHYELNAGMLCVWSGSDRDYPTKGDSGAAFITEYHQQIGLVSLAIGSNINAIIYTNVSFYLEWIKVKSKELNCYKRRKMTTEETTQTSTYPD